MHNFKISNLMPMGWPMGVLGPVAPWQVSKESEDIGHVGYQFYSDFCTEDEYRVNNPFKFQIRRPWGGPWASSGSHCVFTSFLNFA